MGDILLVDEEADVDLSLLTNIEKFHLGESSTQFDDASHQEIQDTLAVIDLKSGFWQIQVEERYRYITAFNVPFGQYE